MSDQDMSDQDMSDQNEFDQPVGEMLKHWTGAQRPTDSVLAGRTVRLEPLSVAHAADLYAALATAPPGHWTYMPWGPFGSVDEYGEWVAAVEQSDAFEYMTICSPEGSPLGVAGYMAIEPQMGTIEVGGITFAPVLQGTIESTEAMYLMMAQAFDDLGFRRYEWKCDSLNGPSRGAAERLGFLYEGTFSQHRVVRGRNRDTAWFGITDSRWQLDVKPALQRWLAPSNFDESGRQHRRLQDLRKDGAVER